MTMARVDEQGELDELEARLLIMLPATYQGRDEDVLPVSMGSADLKYGSDGKVAWDEIWGSFCDLAMAGGPPHKGKLLEPGRIEEIDAEADRYRDVVKEICRGIALVTGLYAEQSSNPGWIKMHCTSAAMAGWLARAVVMENVSANFRGLGLYLPAGPHYRLEKEIKNVVTVVAKTSHYWLEHSSPEQHDAVARLFVTLDSESPLVQPLPFGYEAQEDRQRELSSKIASALLESTGLLALEQFYDGWLGLNCGDVRAAIWMMRVLVVSNVFARREEMVVFVPVNPVSDPDGKTVVRAVVRTHRLAVAQKIL